MEKAISSMKIECVDIVIKLKSSNVVVDAQKLYSYLAKGDIMIKLECAYAVIDKEDKPASVDELILQTEEIYKFVVDTPRK
jgi:hypothetical protein